MRSKLVESAQLYPTDQARVEFGAFAMPYNKLWPRSALGTTDQVVPSHRSMRV
ncbi:MAG: hypothetical protein QOG21_143 [Actinomycetota bacterium]|nr:hypothetical protein [Actinomycetota bacterium]